MSIRPHFWHRVPLNQMTPQEWEALCDGCGQCCVLKLEDEDSGEVHYTNVSCRLFDPLTCRCGHYAQRHRLVPGCVVLSPRTLPDAAQWMPQSCAYRRLYEGRKLADWHPLISGRAQSVAEAGKQVGPGLVPEYEVDEEDLEDHIIDGDNPARATRADMAHRSRTKRARG